ncbi:MAG: D-alanine--D-alanine ligase [Gammaproteobacteria bacterium]|nr:D-alanine--D-alanine ligase [Gammaproteobacteria bacterium]
MTKKLHVGILFGGKSTEHEISLLSAQSIVKAIDKSKYDVSLIGIDKLGQWYFCSDEACVTIQSNKANSLALLPGREAESFKIAELSHTSPSLPTKLDVIFPVLHGMYGEDGSIQGLLKLVNIPFVGAGVLDSAIGMDKDVMKRLLRDADIPISKFLVFQRYEQEKINYHRLVEQVGLPFFVKPANTGSSVGITKVKSESECAAAIAEAFRYDHKILIEEFILGREIECAVLGNHDPIASTVGEIIPHHEFYSYEAKYLDDNGATLKIPADVSGAISARFQEMAINVFRTLCCHGMARVDFFLREDGEIFVNEINTLPGFTAISMYPRLWEASGLDYTSLIDRLLQLALEHFGEQNQLNTHFLIAK